MGASGRIGRAPGPGHFLLGFFNSGTLNEWRTPNTLVARINSRGEVFHATSSTAPPDGEQTPA